MNSPLFYAYTASRFNFNDMEDVKNMIRFMIIGSNMSSYLLTKNN